MLWAMFTLPLIFAASDIPGGSAPAWDPEGPVAGAMLWWLRRGSALILVFLILVWAGSKHVGGGIIVAAKASTALNPQGIRVSDLPNRANYQWPLLNLSDLRIRDVEPRFRQHRKTLTTSNCSGINRRYGGINSSRLPVRAVPQRDLERDERHYRFRTSNVNQ